MHNIIKNGNDTTLQISAIGFSKDEISVEQVYRRIIVKFNVLRPLFPNGWDMLVNGIKKESRVENIGLEHNEELRSVFLKNGILSFVFEKKTKKIDVVDLNDGSTPNIHLKNSKSVKENQNIKKYDAHVLKQDVVKEHQEFIDLIRAKMKQKSDFSLSNAEKSIYLKDYNTKKEEKAQEILNQILDKRKSDFSKMLDSYSLKIEGINPSDPLKL